MPRESRADLKQRASEICSRLLKQYPDATTALNWSNPWELLVATILSAQCTDEKVNEVTADLFEKYKTMEDYARADLATLEQEIRPTGFFRNKAKNIIGTAQALLDEFDGGVPRSMEEMLRLPGVARKTASVVLGTAFGIAEGIAVDTHVSRLSLRMGLTPQQKTKAINTEKIEKNLMAIIPREHWIDFGHAMIWHGRRVCDAKKPNCGECVVERLCLKRGVEGGK